MRQLELDLESAGLKSRPRPDFSGCLQFDPEQRTAEAAATRKAISPRPLHSSYIADLNGYRVTQDMLRHPSGTPFPEIIKVGTLIKTSYGTGPYAVKNIIPCSDYGVQTYHLTCRSPTRSGEFLLNELVAVDGRILALFLANQDEVFLLDDIPVEPGHLL